MQIECRHAAYMLKSIRRNLPDQFVDNPGDQKIARQDRQEEGTRNWEETVCLHSTSLSLQWRPARSNHSFQLPNKLGSATGPVEDKQLGNSGLGREKKCIKYMLQLEYLKMYFSTRAPMVVHTAEPTIEKFDFDKAQGEDEEDTISQSLISSGNNPIAILLHARQV